VIFTWDRRKAAANLKKHGVEFSEAATVFYDSLSTTFPDEDHSELERRFLTVGESFRGRVLVVAHTEEEIRFESSAAGLPLDARKGFMRKSNRIPKNGLRSEYDFASMKGAVRGKYVKRLREGSNIVLLEPEIAAAFPNDLAVNQALRGVLDTARAVRRSGGLANKSLQPAGRQRKQRA
jgi:uncharacterized protein